MKLSLPVFKLQLGQAWRSPPASPEFFLISIFRVVLEIKIWKIKYILVGFLKLFWNFLYNAPSNFEGSFNNASF